LSCIISTLTGRTAINIIIFIVVVYYATRTCAAADTTWDKKTASFYFCNNFVKTSSITTIFGTRILQ